MLVVTTETINGNTFKTISLVTNITITFNPNGGSVTEQTRVVGVNARIGALPVPTRTNYVFLGWFTANNVEATADSSYSEDTELFAHWQSSSEIINIYYFTIISTKFTNKNRRYKFNFIINSSNIYWTYFFGVGNIYKW